MIPDHFGSSPWLLNPLGLSIPYPSHWPESGSIPQYTRLTISQNLTPWPLTYSNHSSCKKYWWVREAPHGGSCHTIIICHLISWHLCSLDCNLDNISQAVYNMVISSQFRLNNFPTHPAVGECWTTFCIITGDYFIAVDEIKTQFWQLDSLNGTLTSFSGIKSTNRGTQGPNRNLMFIPTCWRCWVHHGEG